MGEATVGVRQSTAPDRLIDNLSRESGGQTVYIQRIADVFTAIEALPDSTGTSAASTHAFTSAVQTVVVHTSGGSARADISSTATSTQGVVCPDDIPTWIPVATTSVSIFASTGVTVRLWGYRYG